MKILALFLVGVIAGYLAILFGWIAYADLFDVGDRDGGKIMGIAFTLAPLGALVLGLVLAIAFGRKRNPAEGASK